MGANSGFRITPQVVLGGLIIIIGVLFTLGNLEIIHTREVLRFWPVMLIIYGISKIAQPPGAPGKLFGLFLLFVGTGLTLDKLDLFDFRFWDFWPIALIGLGVTLLVRASHRMSSVPAHGTISGNIVNTIALLGGTTRSSNAQDFRGGELTAIMGGCEIDLRHASFEGEAIIDVFALWGGIEIKVPEDWSVDIVGTPLMGAFEDNTRQPKSGSTKRLVVKGYAIMGGVEVEN